MRLWRQVEQFIKVPFLLTLIFAIPIGFTLRTKIYNPDLWYHLRTGDWILEHHAVTRVDPFAQGGGQRTYIAYSWLFDVTAAKLYGALGLLFVPIATTILAIFITLALFTLLRSFNNNLFSLTGLIVLATIAMRPLLYLRTWLFSMLFLVLGLWLLLSPRVSPKKTMIILPMIFIFWANIHIQFCYGLLIVGLFLAEAVFLRFKGGQLTSAAPNWSIRDRAILLLVCCLATLVNPYSYKIYKVVADYSSQTGVFPYTHETWPLNHHHPAYTLCLIIGAVAIWTIGSYHERRPFLLVLLAWALFTGFHLSRDSWVLIVVSSLVIVAASAGANKSENRVLPRDLVVACVILLAFCGALWHKRKIDSKHLWASVRENYPVDAADFIERNRLSGPLFNTFGWGGYLMWRLPYLPVSIDGRSNLYGLARIERQRGTLSAGPAWAQDPSIVAAHLILVPVDEPLTAVLKVHPCYHLEYSDTVSAVFTTGDGQSHMNCPALLPDER